MSTPLSVTQIAADVYVAGQLGPEAMAELARAGIRSVVNNRPDFEAGADQPANAAIEAAAVAAGLEYRFLPVASNVQTPEQAAAMAALCDELPRPMLLFCRSGARSARLYQLAQALR
jgi:uncharacterized protein (TIGR01244 family)